MFTQLSPKESGWRAKQAARLRRSHAGRSERRFAALDLHGVPLAAPLRGAFGTAAFAVASNRTDHRDR